MSEQITVSREKLLAVMNGLAGSYPNPDDSGPPQPWWPRGRGGPWPDPWWPAGQIQSELVVPGSATSLENVMANPQSLPPVTQVANLLVQSIVGQVADLYDVAAELPEEAGALVSQRAQARLATFVDEFCGSEPKRRLINKYLRKHWFWPRPRPIPIPPPDPGPYPEPPPYPWQLDTTLLASLGHQLLQAADQISHPELQKSLVVAGHRLIDTSLR